MIKIKINNERYCEFLRKENVYKGDNNISNFRIELPQTFGILPREECTIIMNCYLPEDGRLSYDINTDNSYTLQPITNDITEKEQKININFVIKHGDNVIGTTSLVELNILDAPDNSDEPLTPRAEFDEVIAEQRETIAEQAETITEQAATIETQSEQITELSGEVSELTTENTRLENLTETQRDTIQNMLDNPPPNLTSIEVMMIDFTDPNLNIISGGLDTDTRTINA